MNDIKNYNQNIFLFISLNQPGTKQKQNIMLFKWGTNSRNQTKLYKLSVYNGCTLKQNKKNCMHVN